MQLPIKLSVVLMLVITAATGQATMDTVTVGNSSHLCERQGCDYISLTLLQITLDKLSELENRMRQLETTMEVRENSLEMALRSSIGSVRKEITPASCAIEIKAWGYDDGSPRSGYKNKDGYIKINNQKIKYKGRGFTLVTFAPDCSILDQSHFDTYRYSNHSRAMRDFIGELAPRTRIAATTADSFDIQLSPVLSTLTSLGVQVERKFRESLAFVALKGDPSLTVQKHATRYNGPAILKIPYFNL